MDHPEIVVFGKENCGLCSAAKSKLDLMGIPYSSKNIADVAVLHDGWRDDKSCDVLAMHTLIDTLPVLLVDGVPMSYPQTMALLKGRIRG